jgi:hypothetical protein
MLAFEKFLSYVGPTLALATFFWAFLGWLKNTERKRFETERQLTHALNNFASLKDAFEVLQEEISQLTIEIVQIKTLVNVHFANSQSGDHSIGRRRV